MRRRALLSVAAGTLAGLAGCLGDDSGDAPADTPTRTRRQTTSVTPTPSGPATPTRASASTDSEAESPLSVAFRRVDYFARTSEVAEERGVDPDDVVPESEIPDPLLEPLRAARDGGWETDSVSEGLLAAVDEFRVRRRTALEPYVRLDGTVYAFDPTVPTHVVSLADETVEDPPADRTVDRETTAFDAEAVEEFLLALRADGPGIARSEYRTAVLPDPVASFLDEYDYVADDRGVSRIERTRENADPPYAIELRAVTDGEMWGNEVLDAADLDADLREFVRAAVASDHRAPAVVPPTRSNYFTDDVPESYFDVLGVRDGPYVRVDGAVYDVSAGSPDYETPPVSVSLAALPPTEAHERRFEVTVEATTESADAEVAGNGPVSLSSAGGLPSVLWVVPDDERVLLDSDAYVREGWRRVEGDSGGEPRPVNEVAASLSLGESVSATYRVPESVPAGTHVARGLFTVSWPDPTTDRGSRERALYPFRLAVTVGD